MDKYLTRIFFLTPAAFKPANIEVTEAKCDDEDLGVNKTKKFDEPNAIAVGGVVTFYCKADNCNVEAKIKAIVKDDGALTIAAIKAANKAPKAPKDDVVAGAAQSTVAIATIAFSVVMARLAL